MEMLPVPLTFAVLGPPRAWRGGAELPPGPPQQRAVLAALLLREGRPATAQELVDAVWGEDPPRRAVGALRTYAARLRRLLEPAADGAYEVLVSVGDGYALRVPDGALDATAFERDIAAAERARAAGRPAEARDLLRAALARWRGEPLAGVPGPYAGAHRLRLLERRLAAVETRLGLDLELGGGAELVPELTALVAEHPLRERLRGLLMLALHRAGRHAEALDVYAETRRTLVDDLGIEPGRDLSDLHRRLLSAPAGPAGPEPPAVPPAGPPSGRRLPAQLPGDVPDFTGRGRLVGELRGTLLAAPRRAVAVTALSGPGGVGKTALALHVAHQVRDGFPDGQLYIDLRGAGDDPADPHPVLGAFLEALGVERNAIPAGLPERAALYRTRLAGRRVLVLLDDARDARQVRPLLPGSPSCAVLITSRSKLGGLGARPLDLDVMEPAEARALAARIVGAERLDAEPAATAELLAACGRLPLAVRIVAARLAARPSWTVAALAARLADRRRRLAELRVADLAVEAAFQLGYNQLDPARRRAFRLLALAEGPTVSGDAAAALLGLPLTDAEELCESLVDVSLLRSPTAGRYRYHDLLKLYARQRAERDEHPDDAAAALHRLFHFYLATARRAHLLVEPGDGRARNALLPAAAPGLEFAGPEAARDWFFAEAPALFAVIGQAARTEAALPLAADLLLLTGTLVDSGVHARECERAAYAVIDAAWELRDPHGEGRAHLHLGEIYYNADRLDDARAVSEVALRRGRETGDVWLAATALVLLGRCAFMAGRREESLRRHIEALDAFRKLGDRHGEGRALGSLARALLALGRPDEALAAAEHGVALLREHGGGHRRGYALYQLGIVLDGAGRGPEAMACLGKARDAFRAHRNRRWEGLAMFRIAETRLRLGRPCEAALAAEEAEEALRVLRETGHVWGQGQALRVLADALDGTDPAAARTHRGQALRLFERIGVADAEALRGRVAT
ncbi:BTAD domain-containing putative transcriptional regulator [Spirillospora sp. NPDC029432]|uniref:AfsR/SARP family transcriptional regulator n=1 Tax=Spirillospora sp. NPDC029432 TaxID=3154599 RepID=UPI0034545B93